MMSKLLASCSSFCFVSFFFQRRILSKRSEKRSTGDSRIALSRRVPRGAAKCGGERARTTSGVFRARPADTAIRSDLRARGRDTDDRATAT